MPTENYSLASLKKVFFGKVNYFLITFTFLRSGANTTDADKTMWTNHWLLAR